MKAPALSPLLACQSPASTELSTLGDSIYGTVYDGGDPGTFIANFVADATVILERIQELNPEHPKKQKLF